MYNTLPGVDPNDPDSIDGPTKVAFEAQPKRWGPPLVSHLTYARRPTNHRAVHGM